MVIEKSVQVSYFFCANGLRIDDKYLTEIDPIATLRESFASELEEYLDKYFPKNADWSMDKTNCFRFDYEVENTLPQLEPYYFSIQDVNYVMTFEV